MLILSGIVDHQTIFCVFTDLRWFVVVDIGEIVDHIGGESWLLLILEVEGVVVDIGG